MEIGEIYEEYEENNKLGKDENIIINNNNKFSPIK